jgi:general secretion pathway protein D
MRRLVFVLLPLLGACAGQVPQQCTAPSEPAEAEAGLRVLEKAMADFPDRRECRQAYFRERDVAVRRLLGAADAARAQGQWDGADAFYRRALAIDPDNPRAKAGMEAMRAEQRQRAMLAQAQELAKKGSTAAAQAIVRGVLAENAGNREAQQLARRLEERGLRAAAVGPQLSATLRQPISLEMRETSLRNIFEAISRSTGVNFIFDRDVRQDARTTIFVRNSSIEDVLRFVLVTNQLEKKVLSENTLLVYPATAAKARDYQDLVTKTFYLANADAKSTANMIRTLVKTKDLFIDEKLNLLMMRDTPDAVRMAERLVANQDLAEPEVVLEVEVMEVAKNKLLNLGIQYPGSVAVSLQGAGGTPGSFTLREWQNRSSDLVRLTITDPALALNFRDQIDKANLLANPRIRVKNRERAKIHIGDKVPVITTTTTATGFAAESVTYLDVGLKLEVEPQIYLDDEVGIKVGLEVSNIAQQIRGASGNLTYQVGTRNAVTSLRLRDGETQILAGLISDEDRKSITQIPGFGDLPLAGRLFGNHQDTRNKTEIALLITPHVVRNLARPDLRFEEFPSGTESAIGAAPLLLASLPLPEGEGKKLAAADERVRVSLQAPASAAADGTITVKVVLETQEALRGGLLDFSYDASRVKFLRADPGAAVTSADKDAAFRTNAPQGVGRLSLSFNTKADLARSGEVATLVFQAIGQGGPSAVKLEALSFNASNGQVIAAKAPPPVSVGLAQ